MIKKIIPHLLVTLIFTIILSLSLSSYKYINTHDEDDYIVSGYLISRSGYKLYKDIFSHHLPGAYLISEYLDKSFTPQNTVQSVFIHRNFIVFWNYIWALIMVTIFGSLSLWLILVIELLRANYLHSLFHAENLVIYPMVYLLLKFFINKKTQPILSGFTCGLITVLLSPLWPLVFLSSVYYIFLNRHKHRNILLWFLALFVAVLWILTQIDIKEFLIQFFGYNMFTYAPLVMEKPLMYLLKTFLAPVMVIRDLSLSTKTVVIQLLVFFIFIFDFKKEKLKTLTVFGFLLGIIGLRSTPRFTNIALDFHILPWVITLAALCWYKYFNKNFRKKGILFLLVLLLPAIFYLKKPSDYFPNKEQVGKMVIRYADNSPIVNYLNSKKSEGDTLFTLPAHTLLYRQTGIKPFNKFLFYLPWMEQSPLLFSKLLNSFDNELPTFIFIDTIHFSYSPPEEIKKILINYREVNIIKTEPPIYILKSKIKKWF